MQCDYYLPTQLETVTYDPVIFIFSGYHYYHYGAICCSKCKAFFRRCKRCGDKIGLEFPIYDCISGSDNCTIDFQNYHKCMKCRLMRCREAGEFIFFSLN